MRTHSVDRGAAQRRILADMQRCQVCVALEQRYDARIGQRGRRHTELRHARLRHIEVHEAREGRKALHTRIVQASNLRELKRMDMRGVAYECLDTRAVKARRFAQAKGRELGAVLGEKRQPILLAHEVGAIQGEVREMRKPAERAERDRVELATVV